jgi:hypothetical protein
MAATKGNSFYLLRSKTGRDKVFSSPSKLEEVFLEYVNICKENPIYRQESHVKEGTVDIEVPRPMSIKGFCIFAGITEKTFYNYRKMEGYEDYFHIIAHIEEVCYQNSLDFAEAGVYNPSIVARKLKLTDKQEVDHKITKIKIGFKKKDKNINDEQEDE